MAINHRGRKRADMKLSTSKRRGNDEELPRLNIASNIALRNKLQVLAVECSFRLDTGKKSRAPCCRAEGGKVFRCTQFNWEPAKLYDCMVCQKNKAIRDKAEWILPLVQLSQGLESSSYSLDQVLLLLSAR